MITYHYLLTPPHPPPIIHTEAHIQNQPTSAPSIGARLQRGGLPGQGGGCRACGLCVCPFVHMNWMMMMMMMIMMHASPTARGGGSAFFLVVPSPPPSGIEGLRQQSKFRLHLTVLAHSQGLDRLSQLIHVRTHFELGSPWAHACSYVYVHNALAHPPAHDSPGSRSHAATDSVGPQQQAGPPTRRPRPSQQSVGVLVVIAAAPARPATRRRRRGGCVGGGK
jgi:hypothetical protein